MIARAAEAVTWIKVERPTLDLVGLILGALSLTGFLAAVAFVLGIGLGVAFIVRSRRRAAQGWVEPTSLHLLEARRP